ncbi:MAG: phosphoenolpyruvate kinase [Acidobacteriota bacterium]
MKQDGRVETELAGALARVELLGREYLRLFPGDAGQRQPVHTVYGGAHLFKADTAKRLGELALRSLDDWAPDAETLANVVGGESSRAEALRARVIEKLRREPVEDFRIDFEDGYGNRSDAEEDGHAESAAREVAAGLAAGTLPPFVGIRIKPFTIELASRSLRTLDRFLGALVAASSGELPDNFVVTLPKVVDPGQCAVLADVLDAIEDAQGLRRGKIAVEVMIETTQSVIDSTGRCAVRGLVEAARGRCRGAHFGTYDYTAACDITAAHQHMAHPACDFAKHVMQVTLAGTGVWISDGATNVLPVVVSEGPLRVADREGQRASIHAAWRLHSEHVRRSLVQGFYQGWDLHPAQLVTRYATLYDFFLAGLDAASERLRNFVGKAAQATLVGEVFDDAATGQGLLNYFLRALACGALSPDEAVERSGLSLEELRSRSFAAILKARRGA